jgi:hypothetical protein
VGGNESGGSSECGGEWVCAKMRIYFYARSKAGIKSDEMDVYLYQSLCARLEAKRELKENLNFNKTRGMPVANTLIYARQEYPLR